LGFVDPLIGTINGGHVFAGASLPFSMAKAVADTNGDELQGGYASDNSNITGFSHLHDSGTGGVSFVFLLLLDELRCVGLEVVMGYVDGITEKWYFLVHITYLG
jgi:putative alpha-1,2-mannosidase